MTIYTALSRVKTYDNIYCIGEFQESAVKVNKDLLLECEHLKQNDLFSTVKINTLCNNIFTVLIHNVRLLSKRVDDIVSENRTIKNGIIGFIETQIIPSDSTCK